MKQYNIILDHDDLKKLIYVKETLSDTSDDLLESNQVGLNHPLVKSSFFADDLNFKVLGQWNQKYRKSDTVRGNERVNQKSDYSLSDKINYYSKRVNDKSLSLNQREFAKKRLSMLK